MKYLLIFGLFLVSCSPACKYEISSSTTIQNNTTAIINVSACTSDGTGTTQNSVAPSTTPSTIAAPTENKTTDPIIDSTDGQSCSERYPNQTEMAYPSLNSDDAALYQFCEIQNASSNDSTSSATFLIINISDICPDGYSIWNQSANPCN